MKFRTWHCYVLAAFVAAVAIRVDGAVRAAQSRARWASVPAVEMTFVQTSDGAACTIGPPKEEFPLAVSWSDWVDIDAESLSVSAGSAHEYINIQSFVGSFASSSASSSGFVLGIAGNVQFSWLDDPIPAAIAALVPPDTAFTVWVIDVFVADVAETDRWYILSWEGGADAVACDITINVTDLTLQRRYGEETPADRPARMPGDYYAEDRWLIQASSEAQVIVTNVYDADGNATTIDVTRAFEVEVVGDVFAPSIGISGGLHDGLANTTYITQDVTCNAYSIVFDGWDVLFYDDRARAWGSGNKASWEMLVDYEPAAGADIAQATINSWRAADFSNLYVYRRIGTGSASMDDVEIDMLGVTASAAEWRAASPVIWQGTTFGAVSNWPHTGTPTGAVAPKVNAAWAAANGERPDDLCIHLDLGGAFWACQGSPYRVPVTMSMVSPLDPMLPPGLGAAPSTWVGGPGVVVT